MEVEKRYAVKVIMKEKVSENGRRRLSREWLSMKKIAGNPCNLYCVQLLDLFETEDSVSFVLEL